MIDSEMLSFLKQRIVSMYVCMKKDHDMIALAKKRNKSAYPGG